jgi:hypothetical protein
VAAGLLVDVFRRRQARRRIGRRCWKDTVVKRYAVQILERAGSSLTPSARAELAELAGEEATDD